VAKGRRGGPGPRFDSHDRLLDATVASTLDLHGMTGVEAKARATSFLQTSARTRPGSVVHLITGRGKNSPGGSVLKPAVRAVLRSAGPAVAEWDEDVDGGGFLVRLR
jgi:DNA-nicking Smr family endonuclease